MTRFSLLADLLPLEGVKLPEDARLLGRCPRSLCLLLLEAGHNTLKQWGNLLGGGYFSSVHILQNCQGGQLSMFAFYRGGGVCVGGDWALPLKHASAPYQNLPGGSHVALNTPETWFSSPSAVAQRAVAGSLSNLGTIGDRQRYFGIEG